MKKILTTIVAVLMTIGVINYVPTIVNADGGTYESIKLNASTLNASTVYGKGDTEWKLDSDYGWYSTAITSTGAFPDNGLITVDNTIPYQLYWTGEDPYVGKDSIRMGPATRGTEYQSDTYTVNLASYGAYSKIYVLYTGASFKSTSVDYYGTITANMYYTDGDSSTTSFKVYDWDALGSSLKKLGVDYNDNYKRLVRTDKSGASMYYFALQSYAIDCNPEKLLKSISFKFSVDANSSSTGGTYAAVYAVTGFIDANTPSAPTANNVTGTQSNGTLKIKTNWNEVENATSYRLDVSEYSSFTDSDGNPSFIEGYSNKEVTGTSETVTLSNTDTSKKYYYRVRAVNASGQSASSNVATVDIKELPGTTTEIQPSNDIEITYGDSYSFAASTKVTSTGVSVSGAKVVYYTDSACTKGATETQPTNAGTYYARGEFAGDDENYGGSVSSVVKITINPIDQSLSYATTEITKKATDANFTNPVTASQSDATITYTSSNADVATVNETTGEVTIVGGGETTITATAKKDNYNDATATYKLTVTKVDTTTTLSSSSDMVIKQGETPNLTANTKDADDNNVAGSKVVYYSDSNCSTKVDDITTASVGDYYARGEFEETSKYNASTSSNTVKVTLTNIDKTSLKDKIDAAQAIIDNKPYGSYTHTTVDALKTALETANTTYSNGDATLADVVSAYNALTSAINDLVETPMTITYEDGTVDGWDGTSQLEVSKNATITINKDFTTANSIKLTGTDTTVTVNGNNKTITETGNYFYESKGTNTTVTFNNINITSSKTNKNNQNALFNTWSDSGKGNKIILDIGENNTISCDRLSHLPLDGSTMTIKSGNYVQQSTKHNLSYIFLGTLNIEGGTFTSNNDKKYDFIDGSNVTVDNCTIKDFNSAIKVTGNKTYNIGSNIVFDGNTADIAFGDNYQGTAKVQFTESTSTQSDETVTVSYPNIGTTTYGTKTYFTTSSTSDVTNIYNLTSTVNYISIGKDDTGYYLYKDPTKTKLTYSTDNNTIKAVDDSSVVGEGNVETLTLSFTASDITYTGKAYSGITTSGNLLSVTGETPTYSYVGINGTDYTSSSTAPVKVGEYKVTLTLQEQTITDTFKITEPESFTNAKSKALSDLDTYVSNAKNSVTDIVDLTDAEKKSYTDRIDAAKPTIKAAIEAIALDGTQTVEQAINSITQALENGKSTINGIVDEAKAAAKSKVDTARNTAKQALSDKVTAEKSAIDALDSLTEEEKSTYKSQLDTKLSDINKFLDACTTVSDVNTTKSNGESELDSIMNTATLVNTKKAKKAELDTYASEKIQAVKDLTGLTDAEKTAYEAQINKEVKEAKETIDSATSSEGFETVVSDAKKEIDSIVDTASAASELANTKASKKEELDNYANEKIQSVKDLTGLTDEEKSSYEAQINQKVKEAKETIDSAISSDGFDTVVSNTKKDIDTIVNEATRVSNLANKKTEKKAELDKKAEEIINSINSLEDLSDSQKKKYIDQVNKEVEDTKSSIDSAKTITDIEDITTEGKSALDDILTSANSENTFEGYRKSKKNELDEYAQNEKDKVNALTGLTDEEKKAYESKIDEELDKEKAEIDKATSYQDINDIVSNTKTNIQTITNDANGASNLANTKTDKKNELDTKAQEKINEINSNDSLTDPQKKAIVQEINKEVDEAKSNIDSSKTINDVNKIAEEANNALDKTSTRVEEAKKYIDNYFNDSTNVNKDNYQKVLDSKEAYDSLDDSVKKLVDAILEEQFNENYDSLYKQAQSIDQQIKEEKKKASKVTDSSDNSNIFLYSTMLMLAIVVLGLVLSIRRKLTH